MGIFGKSDPKNRLTGYVYVVHLVGTEAYKIGLSRTDVGRRIRQLAEGQPWPLEVVLVSRQIYRVHLMENRLHKRFSHKRMRGEWFALDEADIEKIKKWMPCVNNPAKRLGL